MDCVYLCRPGINEELRYSLRSVAENLPHNNVWVVGGKPNWYTHNHIPVRDVSNKFENIKNCLRAAVNSEEISEDFIMMNDDFFVIKPVETFVNYHGGSLAKKVEEYSLLSPGSYYSKLLKNTLRHLVKKGYQDPIDYDIHLPIAMNKTNLRISLDEPYLERSVYGNMFGIEAVEAKDVKIYTNGRMLTRSHDYANSDSPFVSSSDVSFNKLYADLLRDMFPYPSIYE